MLLSGCARPAGEIFPAVDPPIVFPPPPDVARIAYVGALSTDQDLRPAVSGWQAFKDALAGAQPPRAVSAPAGLAVSAADRLYVTDPPLRCLHIFDLTGRTYRAVFTAGQSPFATPADVAVADGRVYVTDAGRAAIDVFTESGDHVATWANIGMTRPVGIAYDSRSGRLYVADAGGHQCIALSLDGAEQLRFGERGDDVGQLKFPTFLAIHPESGVVVTDSMNARVQRFDDAGRALLAFGRKGDAAGDFALPKGVAVDDAGRVYVADAQFENVQIFDGTGRLLMAFGSEGSRPGQFWLPAKIVIDARRRLWVADSYNRRVQVFRILEPPEV